ncbi:MAG: co-chaperone GroES [Bdellovibrionota bacterium]
MAYKPAPATKAKIVDLRNFLVPLDDRIVVQVTAEERTTPGGLIIPDTVADVSGNKRGTVVAVGRGRRDKKGKIHAMDVQHGDKVVFSQYAGNEFEFNETKLLILRELEVLGILA